MLIPDDFDFLSVDEQIEFIADLEFEENEPPWKWTFLTQKIKDEKIDNQVKIEISELIGANNIPKRIKNDIITCLLNVFKKEDDIVLKQHLILSLQNDDLFSDEVLEFAHDILLDRNQDIDIRYNTLIIINNNSNKSELLKIFKQLLNDPIMKEKASHWIQEMN